MAAARSAEVLSVDECIHLLKVCRSKVEAEKMDALIQQESFLPDHRVYLSNLLIQAYGRCGSVENARRIFDSISPRSVFTWNLMLAAYAHNGHMSDCRAFFQKMPTYDVVSYNTMLAAHSQYGDLEMAKALFVAMPVRDTIPFCDHTSYNILLSACAKCGHLREAKDLFDQMPCKDLVSCTALVSAYAQHGYLEDAKVIFDWMPDRNLVSWKSMLVAYTTNGHLEDARALFEEMPDRDTCSWNVMLAASSQSCNLIEVIDLFYLIPDRNVISWSVMLAVTGVRGAKKWFDRMPEHDTVAWNVILSLVSFQKTGSSYALQLLSEMMVTGFRPNDASFVCALVSSSHAGNTRSGIHYCKSISFDHGLHLSKQQFGCMVDLLGRAGFAREAEDLIRNMPYSADAIDWKSLLSACKSHKELELGLGLQIGQSIRCDPAALLLLENLSKMPTTNT
ncbi:pentatricopeptide repeat-containing protein At4g02750-like [Selaginella moellendorffii]|uniref:pentatricopeptide repeat-containing protein At4g02750-like n=1 Tax=Selaginella moellendorffii TaxID=88036 RepID=UPI000D1C3C9E|nr:pentatricopeptide repeat-containing protein At4g02750-like [Selaginella moellendorffii]|eukprot:XP_024515851.1 pentatricopeptide repeat-containing protein At4g02750-like [Selaginella moellendorffii]